MRWTLTLCLLAGTLVLLGAECDQDLFPVIECESSADCMEPCAEECEAIGEALMSAECDANNFCDCRCTEDVQDDPGAGGVDGFGGG
ncbi:MAG: hypothetical protein AAF436_18485 [Myxococcota bacterium]